MNGDDEMGACDVCSRGSGEKEVYLINVNYFFSTHCLMKESYPKEIVASF